MFIVNALQSHFYAHMVEEGGEFVWKKPEFITIRELFDIISDALDGSFNDRDDGYMG